MTLPAATRKCSLFADRVTEHLCQIRRRELTQTGAFSCDDCGTGRLLKEQQSALHYLDLAENRKYFEN